MTTIDVTKISENLPLPDGSTIVLLDRLAAPSSVSDVDIERNVYRLSRTGAVQWQIDAGSGVYPRTPFTGIELNDNAVLIAYRWDGTQYIVDIDTGTAALHGLAK